MLACLAAVVALTDGLTRGPGRLTARGFLPWEPETAVPPSSRRLPAALLCWHASPLAALRALLVAALVCDLGSSVSKVHYALPSRLLAPPPGRAAAATV